MKYTMFCDFCGVTRDVAVERRGGAEKVLVVLTFGLWIVFSNVMEGLQPPYDPETEHLKCKVCGTTAAFVKVKKGFFGWKQVSDPYVGGGERIPLSPGSKSVENRGTQLSAQPAAEELPQPAAEDPQAEQLSAMQQQRAQAPPRSTGRWGADPSGKWAKRWYDGRRWTEHVEDASGQRHNDPPPSAAG